MNCIQEKVETIFSRKSIRKRILEEIDKSHNIFKQCKRLIVEYIKGDYYASKNKRISNIKLSIDDLVTEIFIAVLPIEEIKPIQAIASSIANRLHDIDVLDAVKIASELLAVCESSGLYTIYHAFDEIHDNNTLSIKPNYEISAKTKQFINHVMYLPPMLCKPDNWTSNAKGGYLNNNSSIILGRLNHHWLNQNLEAVNTIQEIPWELNIQMLKKKEEPKHKLDTIEKQRQFKTIKSESRNIYNFMLKHGNKFYFTWVYDKRGRMYSKGYHINLQSTEYKKSILQFSNKELIK